MLLIAFGASPFLHGYGGMTVKGTSPDISRGFYYVLLHGTMTAPRSCHPWQGVLNQPGAFHFTGLVMVPFAAARDKIL
jgi:hypothetical protein